MSIFQKYHDRYEDRQAEEMTLQEYLEKCKEDKSYYASAAERLLTAIGEPEVIDTREDDRLSRIFTNRKIKRYPAFKQFYGVEDTVDQIVSFFRHAAQGLEEANQILYLLGPVGGGKSSIAERLKELMEHVPFYALKAYNENLDKDGNPVGDGFWEISPVYESPLGLFDPVEDAEELYESYGISQRYLKTIMSPWAVKRMKEAGGDLSKFKVVKIWPSVLSQVAITKVEPGDENNQDISSLVGKVNISELEDHNQNDVDAYSWSGGLNVACQGIMEFVEMFKAPIKMLHPLLTATQEGHYNGTEQFGAIPFQGILLAHSNESEWETFRNNRTNEAFLDRVNLVKVPYCLRVTEETEIYHKLLRNSDLCEAPCAPGTIEMMAQYSVMTRLVKPENSSTYSKMEIYDGKNLKDKDPKAKSLEEYRDLAGVAEGMSGSSTRFAFKILSKVFNYDSDEIAAYPIQLMYVLEHQIYQDQLTV